jgi:hypothetical protein
MKLQLPHPEEQKNINPSDFIKYLKDEKGLKVTRNHTIGWRLCDEKDKMLVGEKYENDVIVFVKIKDCPVEESDKTGQKHYQPVGIKCIPTNPMGNCVGIGKPRRITSKEGIEIDGKLHHRFNSTPVLIMNGGWVYETHLKESVMK